MAFVKFLLCSNNITVELLEEVENSLSYQDWLNIQFAMLIIDSYCFSSTLVYTTVQIYLFHKKCANMIMHPFLW